MRKLYCKLAFFPHKRKTFGSRVPAAFADTTFLRPAVSGQLLQGTQYRVDYTTRLSFIDPFSLI